MGEEIAISLVNVSKCFKRYAKPVDRLKELLLPGRSYAQEFWALRDVSFDVLKGETIGIIGRNGAGKSTLLQLICKTLQPTSGEIHVRGRIAALLELGAGFNPEFTGRENVFMNGAIMGLSRQEVEERFEDIAAFADIGDFIDQPVKTYSSGMYVRLAFAAAIHVDPEILIVDEALAVGDMFFQAKCMARMRMMMESGVTVLFVSHDTSSVKSLCQRCAFLEHGQLLKIGKASEVVDIYIGQIHGDINREFSHLREIKQEEVTELEQNTEFTQSSFEHLSNSKIIVSTSSEAKFAEGFHRYGDGSAKILDIKLLDSHHSPTETLEFNEDFFVQVSMVFNQDLPTFCVGYSIRDLKGLMLTGAITTTEKIDLPPVKQGEIYVIEIKGKSILKSGVYTISVGIEQPLLINQHHVFLDVVENAVVFKIDFPQDPVNSFPFILYQPAEVKYFNCSQLVLNEVGSVIQSV